MIFLCFIAVLAIVGNSLSGIGMDEGIDGINGEKNQQDQTDRDQDLFLDLLESVVDQRRSDIDDKHASQHEYKQTFRTDTTVQINEIAGVVPPVYTLGQFQEPVGKVFNRTA